MIEKILRARWSRPAADSIHPVAPAHTGDRAELPSDTHDHVESDDEDRTNEEATSSSNMPPPPTAAEQRVSPALQGSPIQLGAYLVSEDEGGSVSEDDEDDEEEDNADGTESSSNNGSTRTGPPSRFVQSLRDASQFNASPLAAAFRVVGGHADDDGADYPRHIPQLSKEHAQDIQEEVEFWTSPRFQDEEQFARHGQLDDKGWFWGGVRSEH